MRDSEGNGYRCSEPTHQARPGIAHGLSKTAEVKLVAFDLDGTLVKEKSSWRRVHEFFGSEYYGDEALLQYERGKIDYVRFMEHDISRWPSGLTKSAIGQILSQYTLADGAKELFEYLRSRGSKTAIISSGLDGLVRRVAADLVSDFWLANDLEVDEKGILTGRGILAVEPRMKGRILRDLAQSLQLEKRSILAVGDTRFDLGFFSEAGVSVAVNPSAEDVQALCQIVNFIASDLKGVIDIISTIG